MASNLVSWTTNPVDSLLAVVSVHIFVNVLRYWQLLILLDMSSKFEIVKILLVSTCNADLSINRPSSFAKQVIFRRHESSIAWEVLFREGPCVLNGSCRSSSN